MCDSVRTVSRPVICLSLQWSSKNKKQLTIIQCFNVFCFNSHCLTNFRFFKRKKYFVAVRLSKKYFSRLFNGFSFHTSTFCSFCFIFSSIFFQKDRNTEIKFSREKRCAANRTFYFVFSFLSKCRTFFSVCVFLFYMLYSVIRQNLSFCFRFRCAFKTLFGLSVFMSLTLLNLLCSNFNFLLFRLYFLFVLDCLLRTVTSYVSIENRSNTLAICVLNCYGFAVFFCMRLRNETLIFKLPKREFISLNEISMTLEFISFFQMSMGKNDSIEKNCKTIRK